MKPILEVLNPGWVGSILGIVGILIGVCLYFVGRKVAKPRVDIQTTMLVGSDASLLPDEVGITYQGKSVPRLSRSIIRFWNSGSDVLDGSAIAAADPIRIVIPNGTAFLSVRLSKVLRLSNQIALSVEKSVIVITFDYLNPNDGFIVETLHTSENAPLCVGELKGFKSGVFKTGNVLKHRKYPLFKEALKRSAKVIPIITMGLGLVAVIIATLSYFDLVPFLKILLESPRDPVRLSGESGNAALFFIGGLYLVLGYLGHITARTRYPKELADFESDKSIL
ncbi:hypothetical protein D3C72_106270 [compost metagenome]